MIVTDVNAMRAKINWNRQWIYLGILIILGFLRLVIVKLVLLEPWRGVLVDSEQYLKLAMNIYENAAYHIPSEPTLDFFRTPGYPGFVALIYLLPGGSLNDLALIQFSIVILTAIFVYFIGKELGQELVGFLAGILVLLSPNALFWSVTYMTETIFTCGLVFAFLLMIKVIYGKCWIGWVGILLGFITLIRPIGLILILLWALWFFVYILKESGRRTATKRTVVLLLMSALILLPWFIRNALVHGRFSLSNVSNVTFYSYHLAQTLVEGEGISWEEAKAEISRAGGSLSAAPEILLKHPKSFIQVQLRGIARTIFGTESSTWLWLISKDVPVGQSSGFLDSLLRVDLQFIQDAFKRLVRPENLHEAILFLWGLGYTLLIFILSVIGLWKGIRNGDRRMRSILVLGLITITYLCVSPGAAGEARFRVPIEPILAWMGGMTFWKIPKVSSGILG